MKKIQTTIAIHETFLELAQYNPYKTLAEIIDEASLQLLVKLQKNDNKACELYRSLQWQKQAGKSNEGYTRQCVRIPRQVWEYCEMGSIKKSVYINKALQYYFGYGQQQQHQGEHTAL